MQVPARHALAAIAVAVAAPAALAQSFAPMHGLPASVSAVAYDLQRQRPVATAYEDGSTSSLWEHDGARWIRRGGEAALPLLDPVLVTDSVRGRVLAFDASGFATSAHAYDGVRWTAIPGAGAVRPQAALAFDAARDRVLAFGGRSFSQQPVDVLEAFDGTRWNTVPVAGAWPPARAAAALAFDRARQRAVLFGGEDANGLALGDTWEWDGSTWTQFAGAGPGARSYAGMAFDAPTQTLVLYGGVDPQFFVLDETWQFDGAQWTQHTAPATPGWLAPPRLIEDAGGVLLLGGNASNGLPIPETWRFAGGAWTRLLAAQSPPPRTLATMVHDSVRGEVVLHGGISDFFSAFVFRDTWTFDGAWRRRQPATEPPWRVHTDMAFDRARGEAVLFGGNAVNPQELADTWVWNGTDWAQRLPASSPPARRMHRLVYDSQRQRVVLYGGVAGTSELADTWLWDGTNWQQVTVPPAPPARFDHLMAFDAMRGVTVLFGGTGVAPRADTWLFDGTSWRQAQPTRLPTNAFACAYDAGRGRVVALGDQEWTWNGSDWDAAPLASPRPVRLGYRAAIAFDEARQRLLLFGGNDFAYADTLYAYTPTPAVQQLYGSGCAPAGSAIPDVFAVGGPALRESGFGTGVRADAPARPLLMAFGWVQTQVPIGGGCDVLVDQIAATTFLLAGAQGFAELRMPVPDVPAFRGLQVHAQAFALLPTGLAASRGLRLRFGD